jgi:hypothetical protein
MERNAGFWTLVASLTLGVAVTFGPVTAGGWGAKAQELVRATRAGGIHTEVGNDIAATPSGESYITGFFFGTAIFGPGEPGETELTSVGNSDIFVARYSRDGTLLWATSAGGTSAEVGFSIATTPRGESYVTGAFEGTATFGQGEPNQTTLTSFECSDIFDPSQECSDIFVAKYDRDGALLWATQVGVETIADHSAIATTPRGESYVTFSQAEIAGEDILVAKYDRNGTLLWTTRADGTGPRAGFGIATTPRGESYVTGDFSGTATFGLGEPNQTTLTSAGPEADIFVAKYDRDGTLLWVIQVGGEGNDAGFGIATTQGGDSYVTGRFAGTATFGQGEPNETILTAAGSSDILVAKYDK